MADDEDFLYGNNDEAENNDEAGDIEPDAENRESNDAVQETAAEV